MNFFIDCDGVLNSISKVRSQYTPKVGGWDDWAEWHNRFHLEKPNTEGMELLNMLIDKSDTIHLLSLRHTGLEVRTREYILDNKLLPRLNLQDIHFCPPELQGAGPEFKASILNAFSRGIAPYVRGKASQYITFIDDSMDNIQASKGIAKSLYYPTFRG